MLLSHNKQGCILQPDESNGPRIQLSNQVEFLNDNVWVDMETKMAYLKKVKLLAHQRI